MRSTLPRATLFSALRGSDTRMNRWTVPARVRSPCRIAHQDHPRRGRCPAIPHGPLLGAFLFGRVAQASADDLDQDVGQEVWARLPDRYRPGNFREWLHRVARALIIDQHRRRKPEAAIGEPDDLADGRTYRPPTAPAPPRVAGAGPHFGRSPLGGPGRRAARAPRRPHAGPEAPPGPAGRAGTSPYSPSPMAHASLGRRPRRRAAAVLWWRSSSSPAARPGGRPQLQPVPPSASASGWGWNRTGALAEDLRPGAYLDPPVGWAPPTESMGRWATTGPSEGLGVGCPLYGTRATRKPRSL
jgi:hypothetical protein